MIGALLDGESPAPDVLAQPEGVHQCGTDSVAGAKEHHLSMIFSSREDLDRFVSRGTGGKDLHKVDPNGLVLLGFVVSRSQVQDLLPKLSDALTAIVGQDDAGDEMLGGREGVHHQQAAPAEIEAGKRAVDSHGQSPVVWLFTEGSVPWSSLPGEVGHLDRRIVNSPRIGAWLNHLVCIDLEKQVAA